MMKVQVKLEVDSHHGSAYLENERHHIAEMTFVVRNGTLYIMHTEILPDYQGQGLGIQLLEPIVELARKEPYKVVVYCPYAKILLTKHPEFADVLAESQV